MMETELEELECVKGLYEQLKMIEEKSLDAICHGQLYQSRMAMTLTRKFTQEFSTYRPSFEEIIAT